MPYPAFDRSRLRIQPLGQRRHDLDLSVLLPLDAPLPEFTHPALPLLGHKLVEAKHRHAARILLMGAHVLRAGVARHLIAVRLPKVLPATSRPASLACGQKPAG